MINLNYYTYNELRTAKDNEIILSCVCPYLKEINEFLKCMNN